MKKRIITISREFGSGGRTIGKLVADSLGIAFYDKEIIEKAAGETGFSEEFIEEQGEDSPTKSIFAYSFIGRGMNGMSAEDYLWTAQRRIILDLAEKELYGETDTKPKKRLADKDKKRKINYNYYTDQVWGRAQNYHLTLDSGVIGIHPCAEIITWISK